MPTAYSAATQDALLGRSTPNPIYRRIAAVILLLLMSVVVFFATGLRTVGGLTNSVTISNIVISASIEEPTATAMANAMLSDIRGHIPAHDYAAFDAQHDLFVSTIIATAKDPATQDMIRSVVRQSFILLDTGKNGTVDFTPLLRQFTSALHQADAAFPNNPDLIAPSAVLTLKPNGTSYPIGSSLMTTGWILTILSVLGAFLTARFLVRNPKRQLWAFGLAVGGPGIFAVGVSYNLAHASFSLSKIKEDLARTTLTDLIHSIAHAYQTSGLILIAIAVLGVGLWMGIRLVRQRTTPPTPTF